MWSFPSEAHQENKEHKEHVGHEVDRPEDSVGAVDGVVIEVSQNNPELSEAAERSTTEGSLYSTIIIIVIIIIFK